MPDGGGVDLALAADLAEALSRVPRQLPSKYLYDPLGSSLFEAICRLPWYRITRAEIALLRAHAQDLLPPAPAVTLVELGCGSGEKLAVVADAAASRGAALRVHLVDVSAAALAATARRLAVVARVHAHEHPSEYHDGLRAVAALRGDEPMIVLFLGSNIGNFDADASSGFLRSVRATLRPGDLFLLGADLVKSEPELLLAYDDPLGVTAAFNRNLLVRLNRELGADFDLAAFAHRAVWNAAHRRIEMHLVSLTRQAVRIPAADLALTFERGEFIWTESSHKYDLQQIAALASAAGLAVRSQWVDHEARFALTVLETG